MAFESPVVVVASGAVTANGNSAALGCAPNRTLNLLVNVTAVSGGTPTLAVAVQWSMDGVTFGPVDTTADAFASITGTGAVVKSFAVKAPFYRLAYTVGGTTPSFTLSASAYTY